MREIYSIVPVLSKDQLRLSEFKALLNSFLPVAARLQVQPEIILIFCDYIADYSNIIGKTSFNQIFNELDFPIRAMYNREKFLEAKELVSFEIYSLFYTELWPKFVFYFTQLALPLPLLKDYKIEITKDLLTGISMPKKEILKEIGIIFKENGINIIISEEEDKFIFEEE